MFQSVQRQNYVVLSLFVVLQTYSVLIGLNSPSVVATTSVSDRNGRLITDMSNTKVLLEKERPSKVVILSHVLPIYATLELGVSHIVGLSKIGRLLTAGGLLEHIFTDIPMLPQMSAIFDTEQILLWHPNVILVNSDIWANALEAAGVPGLVNLTLREGNTEKDIAETWKVLAQIADQEKRSEMIFFRYKSAIDGIDLEECPLTPLRVISLWPVGDSWIISNAGSYLNEALKLACAKNIAGKITARNVNLEQIYLMDPEFLLLGRFGYNNNIVPQNLYDRKEWQALRSIRQRHVYLMPVHSFYNWPIDMPLLVYWMRDIFHTNKRGINIDALYRESYSRVFLYDLSVDEINTALFVKENLASEGYNLFENQ